MKKLPFKCVDGIMLDADGNEVSAEEVIEAVDTLLKIADSAAVFIDNHDKLIELMRQIITAVLDRKYKEADLRRILSTLKRMMEKRQDG